MAMSTEDTTKGHKFYLKHLLLLGQAAPVALNAVIKREVSKCGENLVQLILKKKDTFRNFESAVCLQLFKDDEVNSNIDSWDTRMLCVVTLVLFKSSLKEAELNAVTCVRDQRKDLDSYAQSASLSYKAFETKWGPLQYAVLELIKDIHDEAKFECTRMIHSFNSESISVNMELINKMKQTSDVNLHVQMAIQDKVVPKIQREEDTCDQNERAEHHNENPVFIERLQDTFVYVNEPTVLTCKLNVPEAEVEWRQDYKLIEETDTLKTVADRCSHWLAISHAKLTDTGQYACIGGQCSTTASLKVSGRPLMITEELHVATVDSDVRENMDIVMMCSVNLHTNKAVWRHDRIEVKHNNRCHLTVQDREHKLTIRNAKFEDEGDYTLDFGEAISSTKLTIKGNLDILHKKQLTEDLFKNWIRGALGLKYLKFGLEEFANNSVKSHHTEIMERNRHTGKVCTECTADVLLPSHKQEHCPKKAKCLCFKQPFKRKHCPNGGFCSTFYDHIQRDHLLFDPSLANTDVQNWGRDPWSVATCYISTTGYQGRMTAKEVDCSGLLSLFINNRFINRSLGDVGINGETDLFKQAKDARNDILHSANYELSEGQLHDYIDLFKSVLEIKNVKGGTPLSGQPGVQVAINNLIKLRNDQIDIRISQDFHKEVRDLKEHAMNELAKKVDEAEKQNHLKLQHLEEKLKTPFELELHIQVIETNGKASTKGNQRIYKSIKDYVDSQSTKTYGASINITDQSVHRLLDSIITCKDSKIVDVLETDTYPYIKIHCLTCEAIEEFLKLINGHTFQKETIVLRKCLEMQEHIKAFDLITSCSPESIENARKHLYDRGPPCDFPCGIHQGTQCTWYCSDHDIFCCAACKDSYHRTCVGMKQVISDRTYGKQKQSPVAKHKIMSYNVQITDRSKKCDNDVYECSITCVCMASYGNILLADHANNKLKRLDSLYNLVSVCTLGGRDPYDVCYIGDDRAVISISPNLIQFVNVSGDIKLEQVVELEHPCNSLAFHGDTLYVRGMESLYTYNRQCQQKQTLYSAHALKTYPYFRGIAVSDDNERIYIAAGTDGLITIDNKGNLLNTLSSAAFKDSMDVCVIGDGTVLVTDETSGCVYQVDYNGEKILGTVVTRSDGIDKPASLCFDRRNNTLIAAFLYGNDVTVVQLK
ncbi:uncharacterized protein LOC123524103 isoform X2 [Mercenaria mercenaria]|uniref:uncharacterized protein LOC123524103 isoform X2 n=1 Tax=Mercenaria mercenaria TaxID=6596 RepID=UPI00234F07F6|nr:uncharacterized protein LOC123524103 isoform X2 [Mercenaria mercenaria]